MKILIFSGGTGSIALQTGLNDLLKDTNIKVQILTNCYDNGLSTGAVRQVFNGDVLGPSDLRKNQTVQMKFNHNYDRNILKFLETRFTAENSLLAESYVVDLINGLLKDEFRKTALEAVNHFFNQSTAKKIKYEDFSASNIIYASLASLNNNKLSVAGKIMTKYLGIPKNSVILNDDTSLFLEAITESGKLISDEGDIVNWNNKEDPIKQITFENGLKPLLSKEAYDAITESDLIILSSGTQWSSLIPTYESIGFGEAIRNTSAKIVMVMNKVPDKDAPDKTAEDWFNIVGNYFEGKTLDVVLCGDNNATLGKNFNIENNLLGKVFYTNPVNNSDPKKHDPKELVQSIMLSYFGDALLDNYLVFDYDDTLVSRNNTPHNTKITAEISNLLSSFNYCIVSGNDFDHINKELFKPETIYADKAANKFKGIDFVESIYEVNKHNLDIIEDGIKQLGIPSDIIRNRGNISIIVKPVPTNLQKVVALGINSYIKGINRTYEALPSGKTTVEISPIGLTKIHAINDILKYVDKITYLGDEYAPGGNDYQIYTKSLSNNSKINFVKIDSIDKTYLFLKVFLTKNGYTI